MISNHLVNSAIFLLSQEGETQFSNTGKVEHLYTSLNYGLKLGVVLKKNHLFGIDYFIQSHFLDSDQSGAKASDKVERTQLGLVYNYLFKRIIFLFGYYPMVTLKGTDNVNYQNQVFVSGDHFEKGSMTSIGLGFRYWKNTNINLQYRQFSYNDLVLNGINSSSHDSTSLSDLLLSISFPIGFFK